MRILVTGGAGYIGSHAVRLFLARGHDVWVYDNLSVGHRAAAPGELQDGNFIADLQGSFRLKMLKEEEIDLEDVFMGITKGITN
jgi:UDP-glucose 4-epimerase